MLFRSRERTSRGGEQTGACSLICNRLLRTWTLRDLNIRPRWWWLLMLLPPLLLLLQWEIETRKLYNSLQVRNSPQSLPFGYFMPPRRRRPRGSPEKCQSDEMAARGKRETTIGAVGQFQPPPPSPLCRHQTRALVRRPTGHFSISSDSLQKFARSSCLARFQEEEKDRWREKGVALVGY